MTEQTHDKQSVLDRAYDEATIGYAMGLTGFRSILGEVKQSLGITGDLTVEQREALVQYRSRLYLNAMAVHVTGSKKPTKEAYEQASSILALKGYNALAPDKDQRRTKEQEAILTNMRQAWSTASRALGIPAIDFRGGATRNGNAGEGATPVTLRDKHVLRLMSPPDLDHRGFAEEMSVLMQKYLAAHPDPGSPYGKLMKHYINRISQIAEKAEAEVVAA